ncbi:hypothetical protein GF362_07160 [Candidatus Dojkabacteria bacterium]|nr:hypothetical protein [Candidatus Dojkabacteria bacterium]
MIKRLFSLKNYKVKGIVLIVIAILLTAFIYFNNLNIGPDIKQSVRFTVSAASGDLLDSIREDFTFSSIITRESGMGNVEYSLYMDVNQEEQVQKLRDRAEKENLDLQEEIVNPEFIFEPYSAVFYLVLLNILIAGSVYILSRRVLDDWKIVFLSLVNISTFYYIAIVYFALMSLFKFSGWFVTEFTFNVTALNLFLIALIYVYYVYEVVIKKEDGKILSLSKEFADYMETMYFSIIKVFLLCSVVILPFSFISEFTVEILLTIATLFLTLLISPIIITIKLGFEQVFFKSPKINKKKSK